MARTMDFIVGTFNTRIIYTFRFTPASPSHPASISIIHASTAIGSHSWLALSDDKKFLYATAWTIPPSIAAYSVSPAGKLTLLNSKPIRSTSGYVTSSATHIYSAGGSTGEVFHRAPDGSIGDLAQELSFKDDKPGSSDTSGDAHGDFGGLRHGAHSVDLSPDGQSLYIADIGRNCIWSYAVTSTLCLQAKHISPRPDDGPRHTTPHPNGKVLYSLQEHSSMVDAFTIKHASVAAQQPTVLSHTAGVKIIPADHHPSQYWADEVRLSKAVLHTNGSPKHLYASTRGLAASTKGWVAVFALDTDGAFVNSDPLCLYQTATSGGIANAIEPAPAPAATSASEGTQGVEYSALTDSEQGIVFVLAFDGQSVTECARLTLFDESVSVVQAATAVWL